MCEVNSGLQIPLNRFEFGLGIPLIQGDFPNIYDFIKSKDLQTNYNNEMVKQTWKYQKKYGFETNPKIGQEFWNVEADAFKHTFGSADLFLKYGKTWSFMSGIAHEWQQHKNPSNEWNMDSWNNSQGRQIATEMIREYGDNLSTISAEQRNDIIAEKVIQRMRNGQLITHPDDNRIYKGVIEKNIFTFQNLLEAVGIKNFKQ